MDLDVCRDCQFFHTDELEVDDVSYPNTYGVCRRFPPRRIDGTDSGFPVVEDDWWCGEHKKKLTLV